MIQLVFKSNETIWYPDDVARIKKILNQRGYDAPDLDIHMAWKEYSDGLCAGWIVLPIDDFVVFDTVFSYLTELSDEATPSAA